ncbi:uncharacterized protein LOC135463007 [Liolophura sinensis]|uniref:uncharacterized protein LOC135463007 n=1 Tax=Liolophura sinensis TaxID=3198878 RepID=UPI00315841B3
MMEDLIIIKHILNFHRHVIWMALCCGIVRISDAVSVQHHRKPVLAKVNDTAVTLPCNFSTSSYQTPQITWYHEKVGGRKLIMRCDINNLLTSYGEFVNRVARGNRGALVLLRPMLLDSGNYSCEIEAETEEPSQVKTTVTLEVSKEPLSPWTSSDSEYGKGVMMVFVIALFWILPVACSFVLGKKGFHVCKETRDSLQRMTPKQVFVLVSNPVVAVVASCLAFTGTVCTAIALYSVSPEVVNRYRVIGLATGISGILFLLLAVLWLCLPSNILCRTKSATQGVEHAALSDVLHDAVADSPYATVELTGNNGSTSLEEETSLVPQASIEGEYPEPEVTVIKNPIGESVTGMAAMSYKEIYVTTLKSVFRMDISELSEENMYTRVCEGKDELLSVEKYENDLLISTTKSTSQQPNDPYSKSISRISRINSPNPKIYKIRLDPKFTVTWVLTSGDEEWVYLTTINPATVVKGTVDKRRFVQNATFGEHVLNNPTCIVQSSSGQLIVADPVKNDVLVFEENGDFVASLKTFLSRGVKHEIKGRDKLAIGLDDKIYASGPKSENILVFSSNFRFERLIPTRTESGAILSLKVHYQSLYVAHENSICVYPLSSC